MTMFSFFVRTGNLIFSYLFCYDVWMRVNSRYTIFFRSFSGLRPFSSMSLVNFVRTLSFVQGGAKQDDLHDLRNLSAVSSKDEIAQLSNRVVGTIHRTGIYAAFLIFLALLFFWNY